MFYNKARRKIAWSLLCVVLTEMCFPAVAHALTSGPTQPEFQKFTPASATDMVDIFTGDFSYNIPLFELPGPNGGYPFNLSYTAGISMEQEASWVGLGWDINAGAMNRNMRGVPDEFDGSKGDHITLQEDMKKNYTVGFNTSPDVEGLGVDLLDFGSVSAFYNSYKGVGYSIGFGVNVSFPLSRNGSVKGSVGFDMTMNTQEGVDISPNLTVSGQKGDFAFEGGFNASFNSIEGYKGLGVSAGISQKVKKDGNTARGGIRASYSFGAFSSPSMAPSINSETKGFSTNMSVKLGTEVYGVHTTFEVGGFYTEEELKYKNKEVAYPVYGYNHSDAALQSPRGIMDVNRENDGNVNKYTKALSIPAHTYDTWSVTGQGIGQMVRPYKSYMSYVRDPQRESVQSSSQFSVDAGGGNLAKLGASGGFNISYTTSGAWGDMSEGNPFRNKYSVTGPPSGSKEYEPYYYKAHGEFRAMPVSELQEHTGGFTPSRLDHRVKMGSKFRLNSGENVLQDVYVNKSGNQYVDIKNIRASRIPRSNYVLEVKNEQLEGDVPVLKEFLIDYYNVRNNFTSKVAYNRSGAQKHHLAGFVAYKSDGLRYVYALPVRNKTQIEASFSMQVSASEVNNGTNGYTLYRTEATEQDLYKKESLSSKRLSVTKTPEYPHCFPLTSILGTDYVDVNDDGITDDDLGYWVKFGYLKDHDYKWRMPYTGINYAPGMLSTVKDDMGSYVYGERENYFLQTAETKTHIAKFYLGSRADNLPATGRYSFSESPSVSGLNGPCYLQRIELYSKAELAANPSNPVPIKTIFFEYDYLLCGGIKNNKEGTGKLTLKKVYFKYRNNARASHNAYEFEYNGEEVDNYDSYAQDSWGNYKPAGNTAQVEKNFLHPYVDQAQAKSFHDANAAMWNISKIHLPSGAVISVDYEADDYTHVQNKPAMQLYQVADKTSLDGTRMVYFNLTNPYKKPAGVSIGEINAQPAVKAYMRGYLDETGYIYFKTKINLKKGNEQEMEYVSGYARVDLSSDGIIGLDPSSYDEGTDSYTRGVIHFKELQVKGKDLYDHPFSIAAWNFLQLNRPDLIGTVPPLFKRSSEESPGKAERRQMMRSLLNPFKGMANFINGFYGNCRKEGYGTEYDNTQTYIRLNSRNARVESTDSELNTRTVEDFKYGGGHRVKRILIKESVSSPDEEATGIVYDYTVFQGGKWTSSGVATYEPVLGGEENALKRPLEYEVDVKVRSNYKLFVEMPFNQSLYPAASVGYGQVIVRSFATDRVLRTELSAGIPTTGQTVYAFYTAKDFPVITDYTYLNAVRTLKPEKGYAYVYSHTLDYFIGTQGFSIELNDMHGKPKSVESYPISKEGKIVTAPIQGTYYNYKCRKRSDINGYPGYQLINEHIGVMEPGGRQYSDRIVGVDYEVINDLRENISTSYHGTEDINGDVFIVVFPLGIASLIPRLSISESIVQTAVTNKIFYRSGILDETVQLTDGAKVSTKTKFLDALTGQPVVQTITNEYGSILESYNYPAYWQYDGMGPVYKRIGLKQYASVGFLEKDAAVTSKTLLTVQAIITRDFNYKPGDELLVEFTNVASLEDHRVKGTVVKVGSQTAYIEVPDFPPGMAANISTYIYRPAERNQLDVMIGNTVFLNH